MNRPSGEGSPAAAAPRLPEHRLLLACLRRPPGDIHALFGPGLDWNRLYGAAVRHGVAPLVYAAFKTGIGGATVPPAVLGRLAHEYYQQAAFNGHLFAELRKIAEACGRAGIPVLALKGTAIAEANLVKVAQHRGV